MAEDVRRDASEHGGAHGSETVGAHDDHVDSTLARGLADLATRVAVANRRLGLDPGLLRQRRAGGGGVPRPISLRFDEILDDHGNRNTEISAELLPRGHEQKPPARCRRELDRHSGSRERLLGSVGRHEDKRPVLHAPQSRRRRARCHRQPLTYFLRLFRKDDPVESRCPSPAFCETLSFVSRTYAVTWQNGEQPAQSGKLELGRVGISLDGSNGFGRVSLLVPYGDLAGIGFAPRRERLGGRPTLMLDRHGQAPLRIASVAAPGIISEVGEELASLRNEHPSFTKPAAVVVPLRQGKRDEVALLLEQGPPFDPNEAGLERHQVFLSDQEAVFVFDLAPGSSFERLLSDTSVWIAAAAWHDLVAGPPRVATPSFSWTAAPPEPEDLFFDATPGPGDSEGGDIYPP